MEMIERLHRRWKELAWGAGLFLLALALRLVHLASLGDSPFATRLWLDLAFFDEWGRRIAGGEVIGTELFYQDPLYPYFLGAVYAAFGHRPALAIVLQLLLGALVAPLIHAATRRGMGEREAIGAGLLAAAYLPAIFYEGLLLKSWMDLFLVACALCSLAVAVARGSHAAWAATGLLCGAACLARGNLILVLPALAGWLCLDPSALGGRPLRKRIAAAGLFCAGAGLILGACAVRNRAVSGEWVLTTAQAGQNFFIGNNPANTQGECDPLPFLRMNPKYEEHDFAAEARRRTGRELSAVERSRFWFSAGLRWIREHPGDWLRLTWRKTRNFWGAYEIPDNIDLYVYREWAPVLRWPLPGFGVVAPLALVGILYGWRRPGWPRGLLVLLAVYTLAVTLFFVLSRYRLTVMPPLYAFAGLGLVELWSRVRRTAGVLAVLALLACAAFVNLPVRRPVDDPLYRLARGVGLPTRAASSSIEHFNLGVVLAKEGELALAEHELRRALAEEPTRAVVHIELGKVLARAGRTEEAIVLFERAAALEPGQPRTFHTLGLLHRRTGDLAAAERAFREALRLDPRRQNSKRELEALLAP
jgi:tetratricopeptide (TPR) repeat protein